MTETERESSVRQLVVIGSSAGGIDALSTLLAGLPPAFAAPIVIAQHLDPRRPSHLAEILGRRTSLPVRVVADQEPLAPGVVYVVPANRDVQITDHSVGTASGGSARARPSVDRLLESAAAAFGENLIAVILTGSGSDGTAGARAVKASGGTVIIQNPETASFPSMPASLAPSTVDAIANLDAIPGLIVEMLGADVEQRPEDERSFALFLNTVREQSGIDFQAYKPGTIRRRLYRRMAATGMNSIRDYLRVLRNNPDEYRRLISTFLIKVTEFFRDADLFLELQRRIIPGLIDEARPRDQSLRIWSAGCATGEEAYSLAILVAEALGAELSSWNVRIFATDLDPAAIAFARRGVYPPAAVRDVAPELLAKYFDRSEAGYVVQKQIRSLIVFGDHDLAQRSPFPRIDLILCRNVLIYFTSELQRRALHLFAFSLREAGFLVLGKSESTSPLATSFILEDPHLKIYRRHGPRVVLPPVSGEPQALPAVARPRRRPLEVGSSLTSAARPAFHRAETLLLQLPLGVVVVDRNYDIQSINTRAREMLHIFGQAEDRDLLHLLRHVRIEGLRDLIDRALAGLSGELSVRLPGDGSDGERMLRIEGHPLPDAAHDGVDAALLMLSDGEPPAALSPEPAGASEETAELVDAEELRRLRVENRELLASNAELTSANALLGTENEELMIGSEEAQAAAEEVETLNEELQATNEELETLNEELQATVEELNTTNEDMSARAQELQELGVTLQQQHALTEEGRTRLATVIAAMRDAVVVVDAERREVLHNTAYEVLVASGVLLPGDDAGGPVASEDGLRSRAARGETFTLQFQGVDRHGQRRWYEAVGQPIPDGDGTAGGVLVIRDITDRSLAALQEEFVAIVAHELRTPLTALRGYLQLVHGPNPGGDPSDGTSTDAHDYVGMALEQVDRLGTIVADLVDATRIQTGRLHLEVGPVNLTRLATEAIAIASAAHTGPPIRLKAGEDLWVRADAGRVQQVLLNLLTNAQIYAPDSPAIDVNVYAENGDVVVEVNDEGPGIPPPVLRTLFARGRPGTGLGAGLGLGLYISHEIMEALDGALTARSAVGVGTTMVMRLPSADRPSEALVAEDGATSDAVANEAGAKDFAAEDAPGASA